MADALAVFVKTPGLSPIKTRLARSIGQLEAERFYQLSCAVMHERMAQWQRDGHASFWAVAEPSHPSHEMWRDFAILHQGEGDLGARLHHVYASLLATHERVFLVGADAPQLGPHEWGEASLSLAAHDFVMGPAKDGGFYLFGGKRPIPEATWREVAYSQSDTRTALALSLARLGSVAILSSTLTDVDEAADLSALREEMKDNAGAQGALLSWLRGRTP